MLKEARQCLSLHRVKQKNKRKNLIIKQNLIELNFNVETLTKAQCQKQYRKDLLSSDTLSFACAEMKQMFSNANTAVEATDRSPHMSPIAFPYMSTCGSEATMLGWWEAWEREGSAPITCCQS